MRLLPRWMKAPATIAWRTLALPLACAIIAAPAWATQVALVAPTDSTDPDVQAGAAVLAPEAQAVKSALDRSGKPRNAVDKAVLDGVRAFYSARAYQFVWIGENGQPHLQMNALRRRMDASAEDGLAPAAYATVDSGAGDLADLNARAARDVEFSRAAARFVTDLASGAIAPRDVSPLITLDPKRPDVGDVLWRLSRTAGVALVLRDYEPPHPEYAALKARLAALRQGADHAAEPIASGPALRQGATDPRVPLLRSRLGTDLLAGADPDIYDAALAEAVAGFQTTSGLPGDGIVGPRTLAALNGPDLRGEIADVVINMERWRWMPRDLGAVHVIVNVPEFMVRVVQKGTVLHQARVVVGKPDSPTPIFSNVMSHIVVNPYWNVPTSIVSNEMISDIEQDPAGYFAKHGYQVLAQAGGKMQMVDPASLNWRSLNPRSVRIRQVPGDDNALGRVKFMFPNDHAVYLHDTPSKALFKRDYRAFSHGCVRVDNPLDFADAVFSVSAPKWNSRRLQRLYGGPERRVNLDAPFPIHLSYFTATVDSGGALVHFPDVYGYDAKMRSMLGL